MLTYTWILSKIIGVAHRKRFSRKYGIVHHQSFVFILDEPKHDVLHRLKQYNIYITELTRQPRNTAAAASWNYMEAGHGKGPCDPTGGRTKQKADLAVKNEKAIIQDAQDFYQWAKKN